MLLVFWLLQPALVGACETPGVHGAAEAVPAAAEVAEATTSSDHAQAGHECCDGEDAPATLDEPPTEGSCCPPGDLCGTTVLTLAAIPVDFDSSDLPLPAAQPAGGGIDPLLPHTRPLFRPPIS